MDAEGSFTSSLSGQEIVAMAVLYAGSSSTNSGGSVIIQSESGTASSSGQLVLQTLSGLIVLNTGSTSSGVP